MQQPVQVAIPAADEPWYSVRCLFLLDAGGDRTYEERVTIWRRPSFGAAIEAAEQASRVRDSELPPAEYIDRYFDTGREHQGDIS